MRNNAVVLLGSNLGNKSLYLEIALNKIVGRIGIIENISSLYESTAWGIEDQPSFINQVVCIKTTFSAQETLHNLLDLEIEMGRIRSQKWGPRIIDLDLLYFNDEISTNESCIIPHPAIAERKFTLVPLVEVIPNFVHPNKQLNQKELLALCNDKGIVFKYEKRD
jgi:2-amino-4-hydroxy-6-hydroxymethyldihydropteridine diphosphokinase